MKYVCDAPGGNTWFRIETEAEAASESDGMRHAVEKFFRKEQEKATQTFQPLSKVFFEPVSYTHLTLPTILLV